MGTGSLYAFADRCAGSQARFFSVEPGTTAFSFARMPESDAVAFLMSMPQTRQLLFRVLASNAEGGRALRRNYKQQPG